MLGLQDDDVVELPRIRKLTSGLKSDGGNYSVIYYVNGKFRSLTTGTADEKEAIKKRDRFHKNLQAKHGATYRGGSRVVLDAVENPKGDAGIYTSIQYRVVIGGHQVIVTTDKDRAIEARNEYIKENYNIS